MRRQQDRPVRIFSAPKRHELELPILYTNRYMISEGHQRSMAGVSEVDAGGLEAGFLPPKEQILLNLQPRGGVSPSDLSAGARDPKMAQLKHLNAAPGQRRLEPLL